MTRTLLIALVGCGIGLCGTGHPGDPPADEASVRRELLEIAANYRTWGRVDDEARWAPELCRMPMPPRAHLSDSTDEQTHGRKLYSLFARDRHAYARLAPGQTVKVGQVVVKQSWVPEEVTGKEADEARTRGPGTPTPARPEERTDGFYPYAVRDGKVFKAVKVSGLFVMMKLDPKTPGTDDGWVYATLTADGKTITAAGRIESCMNCHVQAKGDRLFGLYREPAPKPKGPDR
jgi:hypothetical protein